MSKPKLKLIWIPKILFLSLWLYIFSNRIYAQTEDLSQVWPTKWIQAKTGPTKEFAVFHFRKTFSLDAIPEKLLVHTSGDMRYQFFVNGQKVTWGPLTGDLRHWYYETTNISHYLKPGKNTLSAVVLNYGSHPPDARLTVQTGFLLAADDQKFRFFWRSHPLVKHADAHLLACSRPHPQGVDDARDACERCGGKGPVPGISRRLLAALRDQ